MNLWKNICIGIGISFAFYWLRAGTRHTAFVVGSTGATGRVLVAQLVERGWNVHALTRRQAPKTSLFPELKQEYQHRVNLVLVTDVEQWAKGGCDPFPAKVDAIFSCIGTSRQNPEVAASMAEHKDKGFAEWLSRIDVDINYAVADAAIINGVAVVARESAIMADANNNDPGFGVYFKHQGIADDKVMNIQSVKDSKASMLIFRPGSLDRGDELRQQRQWERDGYAKAPGSYLPVGRVAKAMVLVAEEHLNSGTKGARIVELPEIISLSESSD